MGELTVLAVVFSLAGLLAGLLTGWLGNRLVFLACLGLAFGVAAVLGIQASLSNGAMSSLEQMIYSALTVWAALVALAVYAVIISLRARRTARAARSEGRQP